MQAERETKVPRSHFERVQLRRFAASHADPPHHDSDNSEGSLEDGTRLATLQVELSEVATGAGGETVFPEVVPNSTGRYRLTSLSAVIAEARASRVDMTELCAASPAAGEAGRSRQRWSDAAAVLRVAPRRGAALLIYSRTPGGSRDVHARYGACPLRGGVAAERWTAQVWVRSAPLNLDHSPAFLGRWSLRGVEAAALGDGLADSMPEGTTPVGSVPDGSAPVAPAASSACAAASTTRSTRTYALDGRLGAASGCAAAGLLASIGDSGTRMPCARIACAAVAWAAVAWAAVAWAAVAWAMIKWVMIKWVMIKWVVIKWVMMGLSSAIMASSADHAGGREAAPVTTLHTSAGAWTISVWLRIRSCDLRARATIRAITPPWTQPTTRCCNLELEVRLRRPRVLDESLDEWLDESLDDLARCALDVNEIKNSARPQQGPHFVTNVRGNTIAQVRGCRVTVKGPTPRTVVSTEVQPGLTHLAWVLQVKTW